MIFLPRSQHKSYSHVQAPLSRTLYFSSPFPSTDKIVETLYSNRVTTDNKRIHTRSPLPTLLRSKLWCLLFSRGSSNSGTTLHEVDGGVKALFSSLEVSKASENPFKTKCLN